MVYEKKRLAFIEKRDGLPEAILFARQTMIIYRRHVLKIKHLIKRRDFIQSYLELKAYYLAHKKSN
jgi:hypothetical protein